MLVPSNFTPPETLITNNFIIRKLCYADAVMDYDAVMSSIDIIQKTRGGDWPTKDLTLLDNQIDLAWHQREFENKSSFAFIVTTLDGSKSLGCVYFYKPGFRGLDSPDCDVDVSFWVTQSAFADGLYPVLYATTQNWLKTSWPFKNPFFSNIVIP